MIQINQLQQPDFQKTNEQNIQSQPNFLDSQTSDLTSENQSYKQPTTRSKRITTVIIEKKEEDFDENESDSCENYQEFKNKQKRKTKNIKKKSLNENDDDYDDDESLVDYEHFSKKRNKSISKYGNKKGRKKQYEKDHFLPLEDQQIISLLKNILLEYEYNYGIPQIKEQNQNILNPLNIKIKYEELQYKSQSFPSNLENYLSGRSSTLSQESQPILSQKDENNSQKHDTTISNSSQHYESNQSSTSIGKFLQKENLNTSLNTDFTSDFQVQQDENKNPISASIFDFVMTPNLIRLQQLEKQLQERKPQNKTKHHNQVVKKQNRSYKLSEDLKMIYIMSEKGHKINGYSSQYWSKVVFQHLIDRPHESLRDRYKRFIKYLNKDNIIDIFKWISNHKSIEGYLNFIKFKNNFKQFSHVSIEDPFVSKKQSFSGHHIHQIRNKCISGQSEDDSDSNIEKKEEISQTIEKKEEFSISQLNNKSEDSNQNSKQLQLKSQMQSSLIKKNNQSDEQECLIKSEKKLKKQQRNSQELKSNQNESNSEMTSIKIETKQEDTDNNMILQHLNSDFSSDGEDQDQDHKKLKSKKNNFKQQQCIIDQTGVMHIIDIDSESDDELYEEPYLKDQSQQMINEDQIKLEENKIKLEQSSIKFEYSQNNISNQFQSSQIQSMNNNKSNSNLSDFTIKQNEEEISIQEKQSLNNSNILQSKDNSNIYTQNQNIQQQQSFNTLYYNQENQHYQINQNQQYNNDMNKQYEQMTQVQQTGDQYQQCECNQILKPYENNMSEEQYGDNLNQQYRQNTIYQSNEQLNQRFYQENTNQYEGNTNQQNQSINNQQYNNNQIQMQYSYNIQQQFNDNLQSQQQFSHNLQQQFSNNNLQQQQFSENQQEQQLSNNQQQQQFSDNMQQQQQYDNQGYNGVNIFQQKTNEVYQQQTVNDQCIQLNENTQFNECTQKTKSYDNNQNEYQNNQNISQYFENQQLIDNNQNDQINNNKKKQSIEIEEEQQLDENNQFQQQKSDSIEQCQDNHFSHDQKQISHSHSQSSESNESFLQYFNDDIPKEQCEIEQRNEDDNQNQSYYKHSRIYFDD